MSLASLLKKGGLRGFATATPATPATGKPLIPPSVATVATVAVASAPDNAANDPDPDRWAWPHSTAMNGAEIDTFTARLARFTDKGLILADAERLADVLVQRDREGDDRRVCLECVHLRHGGRCGNWQAAGIAINAIDAKLPGDFTAMLQRCDGYQSAIHSSMQSIT